MWIKIKDIENRLDISSLHFKDNLIEFLTKIQNNIEHFPEMHDKCFIPTKEQKQMNAEISTPWYLRKDMLSKVPNELWQNGLPKIFEPCCGKGGFVLDIIQMLMISFEEKIPDNEKRYKTIVEECLYWGDIDITNIELVSVLIDPKQEYNLKYYHGNTLELKIQDVWNDLEQFDLIITNPPYNRSGKTETGNTLWNYFVLKSLEWSRHYISLIHPPNWRKPCYAKSQLKGLFQKLTHDNQMLYLEIHDAKDGKRDFNCATKYDWYVVKIGQEGFTTIRDEKNRVNEINLKQWNWLPNYNFSIIKTLIDTSPKNKINMLMNSSYHATREYVINKKDKEHCFTLIHSTPKKGIIYKYSNINNKGHFGVPKIIFGESGIGHVIVDYNGEYGMTQGAMAIMIQDNINVDEIVNSLTSNEFNNILKSCIWGNFRIDWRLFADFRTDFWKYL